MKRNIIQIDEEKCTGCGHCIPACHEGALQIIDNKARLISDLFCDGLGACIGHCPEGAIRVIERDAAPYDERETMHHNIAPKGSGTIRAHLAHLWQHGATEYLNEALTYLEENGMDIPAYTDEHAGTQPRQKDASEKATAQDANHTQKSCCPDTLPAQWPLQLHLIPHQAPVIENADLLLAADCTAYAMPDFHTSIRNGRTLTIACPKLDQSTEAYKEKLAGFLQRARSLTVAVMEVPCCSGLAQIAKDAREQAGTDMPIKQLIIGIDGTIQTEGYI